MMVSTAQDEVMCVCVCVCAPRIPSLADPLEGMVKFNVIGALCQHHHHHHPRVCLNQVKPGLGCGPLMARHQRFIVARGGLLRTVPNKGQICHEPQRYTHTHMSYNVQLL